MASGIRRLQMNKKHKAMSQSKAKEIMEHGEVRGHKLTKKQKGLFGMMAGGKMPYKMM